MLNGLGMLESQVRDRVRENGLDPVTDRTRFLELVHQTISDYETKAILGKVPPLSDPARAAKTLIDLVAGLGPIQRYMDDPTVEEIWINSPHKVFIARDGVPELTSTTLSEDHVKRLVEHMLNSSGRRLDMSHPFVDAMLPGGERLHVVIPDITQRHFSVNIRKFVARGSNLSDLVARGMLTQQAGIFLSAAVRAGLNILVSGATGAGKTTFLRALAGAVVPTERIITVEEVFELNLQHRDVIAMQCRQANLEGNGEVTLRRLVKESLRMRPDRIIVGEVREAEALDLLIALNSGLPGFATIHANNARDAVIKVSTLPLLAGENVTAHFVNPTVASAIDIVVHINRDHKGRRTVQEIAGVTGRVEDSRIEMSTIFHTAQGALKPAGGFPPKLEEFERHGFNVATMLGGNPQWA
ncbi:CpaF family protein [Timonella sp. A28]|uniref:CpaF family protein n=1 Tax=Timonella sp. A28 TaxID=3442640 RepID=UPI003EBCB28D